MEPLHTSIGLSMAVKSGLDSGALPISLKVEGMLLFRAHYLHSLISALACCVKGKLLLQSGKVFCARKASVSYKGLLMDIAFYSTFRLEM